MKKLIVRFTACVVLIIALFGCGSDWSTYIEITNSSAKTITAVYIVNPETIDWGNPVNLRTVPPGYAWSAAVNPGTWDVCVTADGLDYPYYGVVVPDGESCRIAFDGTAPPEP